MTMKKGFTLIEMLIVIVIVGILASALVPKLVGVQERARDVARSSELQQISSAIMTYELDNGKYPGSGGAVGNLSGQLLGVYLKQMPKDPKSAAIVNGCDPTQANPGEYFYTPIKKRGINGGAFALVATVEQISMANFVSHKAATATDRTCPVSTNSEFARLNLCENIKTVTRAEGEAETNTGCVYDPNSEHNQLMFIIAN